VKNTVDFNENNWEKCLMCYLKLKIVAQKCKQFYGCVLKKRNVSSWKFKKNQQARDHSGIICQGGKTLKFKLPTNKI